MKKQPKQVDFTSKIISVDDMGTIEVPLSLLIQERTKVYVTVYFNKREYVFVGSNRAATVKLALVQMDLCKSGGAIHDTRYYMTVAAETLGLNNFKIV